MSPLKDYQPIGHEAWQEMASRKLRAGGKPRQGGYLVEDELIKKVVNEGASFELQYARPEEVEKMRVRLNARVTGMGIRVLTDAEKPNSVFIGPLDKEQSP